MHTVSIGRNVLRTCDGCNQERAYGCIWILQYILQKQTYLETYEGTANLVGNLDEWKIPREMENMEVKALIEKCTARSPKKTKLLSHDEFRKHNIKCGKYGEYGHNKKTCRNRGVLKPKKK